MDDYVLLVGDVDVDLANLGAFVDNSAYLITKENFKHKHKGTVFVSLGDLDNEEAFYDVLSRAKKIICIFPRTWSDQKFASDKYSLGWHTVQYVQLVSDLHGIPVKNFFNNKILLPSGARDSNNSKQIWVAGCSSSYGLGIEKTQRYSSIITNKTGYHTQNISIPGSSNNWQATQLLCSDIQSHDIVVWGLTDIARTLWFDGNKVNHIVPSSYLQIEDLDKHFPIDSLNSMNALYNSLISIQCVQNHCNQIGAKLLLVSIHADIDLSSQLSHKQNFLFIHGRKGSNFDSSYLDYASDKCHPGPKTHAYYAEEIINKLNELNWI